jgi:hypothetical protein
MRTMYLIGKIQSYDRAELNRLQTAEKFQQHLIKRRLKLELCKPISQST